MTERDCNCPADMEGHHPLCLANAKAVTTDEIERNERYSLKACIWKREGEWREREEWVLEIEGELNDCAFVARHTEPLTTPLEDVAGLPSLYAAMDPERLREPATGELGELIDRLLDKAEGLESNDVTPTFYADEIASDLRKAAYEIASLREQVAAADAVHVVFDGPPGHESGRFVECETPDGRSINAGEWHERADGFWELRIARAALKEGPMT